MVKNKALPDSARPCKHPPSGHLVILSLSLSLAELALSRLVSRVFSLSLADAIHPEGIPWILPSLDPGSYGFSSGHVWMWELDYKESWALKNCCFWTVVLKTPESPLDCKEIQPVHPKGNQSWVFTGRTDVEAETPILWPPDAKSWLIWKDPDAKKDWGQEE